MIKLYLSPQKPTCFITTAANMAVRKGIAVLVFALLGSPSQAAVVDLSNCTVTSTFAIATQSEGPTYACGGIDTGAGNPINVLNGNKFEPADDLPVLPGMPGISFSRYYNSHSNALTGLGYGWYSTYDVKLYDDDTIVQVRADDGRRINFKWLKVVLPANPHYPSNPTLSERRGYSVDPRDGWVEKRLDGSGWVWHVPNKSKRYEFKAMTNRDSDPKKGYLRAIRTTDAAIKDTANNITLRYNDKEQLIRVSNGHNDAISFAYQQTQYKLPQVSERIAITLFRLKI